MNISRVAIIVSLAGLMLGSIATAMSFPPEDRGIILSGTLSSPYISVNGGTVYLQMSIATPAVDRKSRRPMNMSVVLDRSGSMAEAGKFEYAKQALHTLIDNLGSEDIFSLVVYDDVIEVSHPAGRVKNKAALRRLLEGIHPRGATNLGGGMIEGFRQVERNLGREYVNRVILLSDGLANQGITNPRELDRIARMHRARSISLTTMGVGLEYNENLMVALSEAGGGNYYFIESPHGLASIMSRELNTLSSVIAQNASIELTLGRNVRILDVIGCEHRVEGSTYVIPVGDLSAQECREFTIALQIPEGTGSVMVATGILKFESDGTRRTTSSRFSARIRYTRDVAEVEKNKDWGTQTKADIAVSTRAVEKAMKALDDGRQEDAARELNEAKESLMASPTVRMSESGAAAVADQVSKLEEYSRAVGNRANDARLTKKSIQYDNYRVQRNK